MGDNSVSPDLECKEEAALCTEETSGDIKDMALAITDLQGVDLVALEWDLFLIMDSEISTDHQWALQVSITVFI